MNNRKIGIITFHRTNNLGAVLQAYALNQYILDSEIIDYIPNNLCPPKGSGINIFARRCKRNLEQIFINRKCKNIKFNKFRTRFVLSKKTYYGDDDICSDPPKYDVLISGSDQILNTSLTGTSKAYYLFFDEYAKKISYASSFGRENVSDEEKRLIETELRKFESLSVREQHGQNLITSITQKRTELVVDPVFLLDKKEWLSQISECSIPRDKKYIFVYAMEETEILYKAISFVEKKYNLPVIIVLGGGNSIGTLKGKIDKSCGPEDFIHYINNAEVIVTNSFHGTAFSIMFGKEFICVAHSKRNIRLENIMQLVNATDKLLYGEEQLSNSNVVVNGEEAYLLLKSIIEKSKNYLTVALNK